MSYQDTLRRLRNIGISAHVDAGKTTATERILFFAGENRKMGDVDDGDTTTDFMKQERERGITIQSAAVTCHWADTVINLIDTPGHVDFTMEVERSMRVLDGTVIVLCAKGGVQPQTKTVWRQANRYKVPRILFVNKMDTLGANFERVVEQVRTQLRAKPVLLQLPIGSSSDFVGVVDLLTRTALLWDGSDDSGKTIRREAVPASMQDAVEEARAALVESIVETDDALLERFLSDDEPSVEELKQALRQAVLALQVVPMLCGSAFKKKGVQPLLDAVVDYLPSPIDIDAITGTLPNGEPAERKTSPDEPLAALAFKVVADAYGDLTFVRVYSGVLEKGTYVHNSRTGRRERIGRIMRMQGNRRHEVDRLSAGDIGAIIGLKDTVTGDTLCDEEAVVYLERISCPDPVISLAVEATDRDGTQKMTLALQSLAREDPSFRVHTDSESGQTIISGLGELHLDVKRNLLEEMGIRTNAGKPQVSYRETIQGSVRHDHTFKKQTGGRGMFAAVTLEIEPLAEGDFEFEDATVGGSVPSEFIGAVEKGVRSVLTNGPLSGCPVVGVKVSLVDGKSHDVDSNDMAFQLAAASCFREAIKLAKPALLEPIMSVEVVVPATNIGDVNADISRRRGQLTGTDTDDGNAIIHADVPLATTFGYSTALRSATSGNGSFSMELKNYQLVPASLVPEIIKERAA